MTIIKNLREEASPTSFDGGTEERRTVKLITCDDAFRAHVIQGALENEGIVSVLHNEHTSSVLRGYGSDIAGVDVLVYEEDYDRALLLLEQNRMVPSEPLKYCPCCGSDEIRFVLKRRHKVRAMVAAILSALSAAPPGAEHWEYVCSKCGARFEEPVAKEREKTDSLSCRGKSS